MSQNTHNKCAGCDVPAGGIYQIGEPALEALRERLKFPHMRHGHADRFVEAKASIVAEVINLADQQSAVIASLEAQMESIGAGGVEPLRKPAEAPQAVPFMWAIQEPDGSAYMDENCVSSVRENVQAEVDGLNSGLDAEDGLFKVVPVYLAAAPQAVQHVPWCPDVCPITGRKFFMWIEHWATGKDVPTYGGPYDSYTIPVKEQDGTFTCERYDHDAGEWMTEGMGWECVGVMLVDDQSFVVDPKNPRYMEIEEFATQPAAQGMDAQTIKHISALSELVRMPNAEHFADAHNAAVRHLRALATQAKQGGV